MTRPIVIRELRSGCRTRVLGGEASRRRRAEDAPDEAQHGRHDDVGAEHDAR